MSSDYLKDAVKQDDEAFESLKSLRRALLDQKHFNSTLKEQLKHATKIQLKLEDTLNLMEKELQQQLEILSVRRHSFEQCSDKEICGSNGQTCRLEQFDEINDSEIVVISSDDEEPQLSHVGLNRQRKNNGASDREASESDVNIIEVWQCRQQDDSVDTEFDFNVTENHQLGQIDAQVVPSPIDTNYAHQFTQTENHQLVQIDAQVLPNPIDTNYVHQSTQTEGAFTYTPSEEMEFPREESSQKIANVLPCRVGFESSEQSRQTTSTILFGLTRHREAHSGIVCSYKPEDMAISYKKKSPLMRGESKVDRPFKCTTCHYGFSRNDHLTRHLLTHTNERPFTCDFCKRSFRRKDHLRNHMNTHIGGTASRKRRV